MPVGYQPAEELPLLWSRVSEQPIEIKTFDAETLAETASKSDVLLLWERNLGEAVDGGSASELPENFVKSFNEQNETLRHLVEGQTRWHHRTAAISLGSPVLAVMASAELSAPRSWPEWTTLAEKVSAEGKGPQAAEPLADGWGAIMFLKRVASLRPKAWLFYADTMKCSLELPEYVDTLSEMVEVKKSYPSALLTPEQIREQLAQGKLAIGITFPIGNSDANMHYAKLPAGRFVQTGRGPVVTISKGCRQTTAARTFIQWLAGPDGVLATSSTSLGLINSLSLERSEGRLDSDYLRIVQSTLDESGETVPAIRLLQVDRYLELLDQAVIKAISGEMAPAQALSEASAKWNELTDQVGSVSQRRVWMNNQGLSAVDRAPSF